jgi:hypothetical protein
MTLAEFESYMKSHFTFLEGWVLGVCLHVPDGVPKAVLNRLQSMRTNLNTYANEQKQMEELYADDEPTSPTKAVEPIIPRRVAPRNGSGGV